MFGFGNSKDALERKAAKKNEELAALLQQLNFYREKTDILSANIIDLQKNPEANESRIHEEAESLIGHSKKIQDLHRQIQSVLKDIEKVDKKLSTYKVKSQ